jgi:hypothetical protein
MKNPVGNEIWILSIYRGGGFWNHTIVTSAELAFEMQEEALESSKFVELNRYELV